VPSVELDANQLARQQFEDDAFRCPVGRLAHVPTLAHTFARPALASGYADTRSASTAASGSVSTRQPS
jgi:hypothetical protein